MKPAPHAPTDMWRCTHLDADGRRCPYPGARRGNTIRCWVHRPDAPDPTTKYPMAAHHCSGCCQ